MAKDPAFLFYTQDFTVGTQFFSDEQAGKYIRLLCAQHQHGRLTEKHMLSICKAYDVEIFSKFTRDDNGFYFNERLENETTKRKNYSESRRKNAETKKAYAQHMENENENSIGISKNVKERVEPKGFFPTHDQVADLPELKAGSVIEMVKIMHRADITPDDVSKLWYSFKIQHLTGKKFYNSLDDVYSHFINWAKNQQYVKSHSNGASTRKSKQPTAEDLRDFINS